MSDSERRAIFFVGSSQDDLKEFPKPVRSEMGHALDMAQAGGTYESVKQLKGFKIATLEVVTRFDGEAFRTVYTVKLESGVYVLHAFQKKAKRGRKTPQTDIGLIRERLKRAIEMDDDIKKAKDEK